MNDLAPQLGASLREFAHMHLDFVDQLFSGWSDQKLVDIPSILRTTGVELEKDEIGGASYGDFNACKE